MGCRAADRVVNEPTIRRGTSTRRVLLRTVTPVVRTTIRLAKASVQNSPEKARVTTVKTTGGPSVVRSAARKSRPSKVSAIAKDHAKRSDRPTDPPFRTRSGAIANDRRAGDEDACHDT